MAGAQLPSCVLRTWAKNFNSQRPQVDPVMGFALLCFTELLLLSYGTCCPVYPLTFNFFYPMNKFYSGLTLCLPACYLFFTQNLHLTDPAVCWHCRRFAQINITFLHLPQGETMIKSGRTSQLSQPHPDLKLRKTRFCICLQRGW